MNPDLYKVRLDVANIAAEAFAEAIEPYLVSVTWTADEDDPTSIVIGFNETPPDAELLTRAITEIAQALSQPVPTLHIEKITGHDWLGENKQAFPPIREGRFFIYIPDWEGTIPAGTVALNIPAAGAFGTGRHGSTQGCLAGLETVHRLIPGDILDMGCGSGILGLAAIELFHRRVLGSDIDSHATKGMIDNARANAMLPMVRAVTARGYRHPALYGNTYALIFANILAKPLTRMAPDLVKHLKPGGIAILSGLLPEQGNWVASRHRALGLKLLRRIHRDGWLSLVMQKPYSAPGRSR
jgi:ribosomal protein L11 methyltransferase